MDLMLIKKYTIKRQKNHGLWAKYRFGIQKDKGFEAEKRWGLTNNAFWLTKGINGIKAKKDGVWTKYDFDVSKWIWGKEEEKLWVLKELWIWLKQNISKQSGKKIMGIEQTMDLVQKQRIQGRKEIGVLSKLWILELVKKQRIQGRK